MSNRNINIGLLSEFSDQTLSFIRHGNTERIYRFNWFTKVNMYIYIMMPLFLRDGSTIYTCIQCTIIIISKLFNAAKAIKV
jgi:hypothetical protein